MTSTTQHSVSRRESIAEILTAGGGAPKEERGVCKEGRKFGGVLQTGSFPLHNPLVLQAAEEDAEAQGSYLASLIQQQCKRQADGKREKSTSKAKEREAN